MRYLRRLLQFPLRIWHRFFSPMLPPMCRFEPSCSVYAVEAIEKLPLHRAFVLILWRVLRCNPLCKGGHDPVPDPKLKMAAGMQGEPQLNGRPDSAGPHF